MEEIKLNLLPTDQKDIVIRTGDAPKVYDPVRVVLSGTISAPADFVEKRKDTFKALEANVIADYKQRTITLTANENSFFATTVSGALELYPDLKDMRINANQTYTHNKLYDLLKFKGAWFKNKEAHTAFLEKLKKFEANVSSQFQNANDFKGAQAYRKVVDIKTNLDLEFELRIPVFTGEKPVEIPVDVCVDIKDGEVVFWLESVSLHETIVTETERIFEHQLNRLADFVIIKKW